jgi:hypothetical protein
MWSWRPNLRNGVNIYEPMRAAILVAALVAVVVPVSQARQAVRSIPDMPLRFAAFSGQFRTDGTFCLAGEGWPAMQGRWTIPSR